MGRLRNSHYQHKGHRDGDKLWLISLSGCLSPSLYTQAVSLSLSLYLDWRLAVYWWQYRRKTEISCLFWTGTIARDMSLCTPGVSVPALHSFWTNNAPLTTELTVFNLLVLCRIPTYSVHTQFCYLPFSSFLFEIHFHTREIIILSTNC